MDAVVLLFALFILVFGLIAHLAVTRSSRFRASIKLKGPVGMEAEGEVETDGQR